MNISFEPFLKMNQHCMYAYQHRSYPASRDSKQLYNLSVGLSIVITNLLQFNLFYL